MIRPFHPRGRGGRTVSGAVLALSGAASMLLGAAPLAGWLFHYPALTRLGPSFSPMAANAAAGLALEGAALMFLAAGRRAAALAAAVWSLLAGGLTLAEYALSANFHIDQLLARDYIGAYPANPGRMAPNAAVCLVLCGVALLWARERDSRHASTVIGALGAVTAALGAAAVAGYLTGIPMHAWGRWTHMAANAGIGFVALGLGLMRFAWQSGGRERAGRPHWLALAAGSGGLTLSLCLGYVLIAREPRAVLPVGVIGVGACISVLLGFVVELAFAGKQRANAAEQADAHLMHEVRARRGAQDLLRATYSELAVIHDNAPVALLVVDDQLRVEKANAPAARLAQREVPDIVGLRFDVAIGCLNASSDPQGCGYGPSCGQCPIRTAALDSLSTGARHVGIEAWVPVSDGRRQQQRCLLVSTAAIELDHSKKVLICAQDMTEHRRDEREIQRQARLIELSQDAIIKTDANRMIQRWNSGAEEIYGWKVAEARGKMIYVLLQTHGAIGAGIDAALSRDGRWEGELVQTRRDGRQIVTESRQVLVRDHSGAAIEILEINRDITERKRAQQELSQAHRRTTAILESISDGFNFLDRDWRYAYVNPAAARLVHKTREELLGKNLWELWPYTADSAFGAAYRRAVAENIPVQVEAFYPEPLNAWLDVRCYPSPEGLSLFFTDTTARKRDEEKLRETVRAMEAVLSEKTVLLKEINHRVKNNLAVIASVLNMQACASENPEARRALDDSQRRVHAMALIHEHLYGSDHLDRIEFSEYARELVEEIYAATIHGRGRISLSFDSHPIELGVHRAVPCALILNELLSNVFKYAFPDGRKGTATVTLTASTPGSVELAVADDGVGLPPGWENSQSLGWQIVKILTAQLEGSITAEPCSGTRFVLRFPIGSGRCLDPEQP